MNYDNLGRLLLVLGVSIALLGGLIYLLGRFFPGLSGFPGTIKIQTSSMTCLIPLLASIVLSIILTVVLNLVIRFLNK
jgi:hypothetical protein